MEQTDRVEVAVVDAAGSKHNKDGAGPCPLKAQEPSQLQEG